MNRDRSKKKLEDFRIRAFQSQGVLRRFEGVVHSPPKIIYPLLCSVREADWQPDSYEHVDDTSLTFTNLNQAGNQVLAVLPEDLPFHRVVRAPDHYIQIAEQLAANQISTVE